MATRVLLYRGRDRFVRDGVLVLPCAEFLAGVHPDAPLPGDVKDPVATTPRVR